MGTCLSEPIQPEEQSSHVLGWTGQDLVLRWALWQPEDDYNYHHVPPPDALVGPPHRTRGTKGKTIIPNPEAAAWAACNKFDGLSNNTTQRSPQNTQSRGILSQTIRIAASNALHRPIISQRIPQRLSLSPPQIISIKQWVNIIEKESRQKLNPLQKLSVQNFWINTHLTRHSAFFQARP